jgi:hypothetical protein
VGGHVGGGDGGNTAARAAGDGVHDRALVRVEAGVGQAAEDPAVEAGVALEEPLAADRLDGDGGPGQVRNQPGLLPGVVAGERAHDGKPGWLVEYYCYPSSFEPRGPKAKQNGGER